MVEIKHWGHDSLQVNYAVPHVSAMIKPRVPSAIHGDSCRCSEWSGAAYGAALGSGAGG